MGTMHHLHPADTDGETTIEFNTREDRRRDVERLAELIEQRRKARPGKAFTRAAIVVGVAAAVELASLAVHTAVFHDGPNTPLLAAHQVLVVSLSVAAVCMGVGWARWNGTLRAEAQRDEMDEIRHRQLLHEVRAATQASESRELTAWATGLRDAAGQRVRNDQDGSVTQMWRRTQK